ncbi:outer membrane protein assembly factor BamE [Sphingosinicella sp. LHD-64]|uniref:outer membrane protein assembly factor BamE n=1 Tax=Sphingosinicella sp. LHD-64 TaxID=3072139 RepID=UPI00280C5E26|nr:outer membrane protein assembly factor BamE [Sphingosinicella sp. LHD-64]MDQ8756950.1 outer membrane protein assembly factor BamE [Sphingosinicella sp. LHD-64]
MPFRPGSRALLAIALGGVLVAGCSPFREHQGYLVDTALVESIQPGVDNRESVQGTLGRPTFTGQFDQQQRDWYYVSRDTAALAFRMPRPTAQTVLHVRFNEAGNVESVNRTGLELVARIRPDSDKTPTLGRHRSLFEELFGNIGAVGQGGQRGQTADNPQ